VPEKTFRWLSADEFNALSLDEKREYIKKIVAELERERARASGSGNPGQPPDAPE
jgi:hypothetical protein